MPFQRVVSSLWALLPASLAPAVFAGCLSPVAPPAGSMCSDSSDQLSWLSRSSLIERFESQTRFYDDALFDPAFGRGVSVKGDLRFELQARGPHLVEVFLIAKDQEQDSFVLEADGAPIDTRYQATPGPGRLRPKRGMRHLALLGVVKGPATLTIQSDSPRYVFSAVRWTPQTEFEEKLVPAWLERARRLLSDPFLNGLRSGRRNRLEQLFDRLALSGNESVRREAVIGQARAMYWLAAENHEPRDIARTAQLFREALGAAPADLILRQMVSASCLGLNVGSIGRMPSGDFCDSVAPVPWPVSLPPAPDGAPEWAVAQRKLAARMGEVTRWWVEKRQRPDGELGGGWGDDVEILRHWGPEALGFGSSVAARGLKNIADGLWSSGTLSNGYDKDISDVEHSSEPTTDTQPLLAAVNPDNPAALARLKETADCAQHWIAQQPDGRWRFRGSWFNCRQFDPAPERAVDVHLNVRAMGPALWYAYLTRDRTLVELLANWADSWVEAMRSTRHGKPAGLFPSAVNSADGSYLIASERWDKPGVEWDYFQWSGNSQEALTSLVLSIYDLTGEQRWLEAAGESFRILDRCAAESDVRHYCDEIVKAPAAFYEWRRRSGDTRYDKAFGYAPEADLGAVLTFLAEDARSSDARLGVDFDMYTSEVIYTDRVYYPLSPRYRQYLFGGEAPRGERYPTFAVTWPAAEGQFARAVIEATAASLKLQAYNFERRELGMPVRIWRLAPGRYQWQSTGQAGAPGARGEFTISARAQIIRLPLPPATEVTITIERLNQ